jgi:hypothetical protein
MRIATFEEGLLDEIQAQRCKKLLWSVIQLAVDDACKAPYKTKPQDDTITAMRFLIGDKIESGLDSFLLWLDVDAKEFRRRLVEAMFAERHDKFTDFERRAFRANYNWYLRNEINPDN